MERNKSDHYSKKLEFFFKQTAALISIYPEIGVQTDIPYIRVKVVKDYKVFYWNNKDSVQIIRVWDSRNDPGKLKL